jgi:hypothetical protein
MNYSELVAAVSTYVENTFPTTQMDTFIKQAEQRIYNSMQFPSIRKTSTLTLTASSQYLNCPDDFLAVYSMAVIDATGVYTFLLDKDVNFIREAYPTVAATGTPRYYAIFGPQVSGVTPTIPLRFILGPTPNAALSAELQYFYYPESIVTASTTWLGNNFDSVLLYGTLVEAYTYMKGEADVIALYDNRYKEALGLAKRLADGMERQDAYRSGQARIPVT